ncbi:MAG TPA: amidohydrolase family protein [Acidimicrobiales bacterium]|nr:amidohydrolase family protein [Acidimicrobiales bacterium]
MAAEPEEVDLLVANGHVVTMDGDRRIIDGGAVAVDGGTIRAVGGTAALRQRFRARREIDAGGGLVTPGFVNAHQHVTGGPLVWSCIPDNLVPGTSIFQWSVPLHAAEQPADEELSAMVAAAESLRSGTTTLVEPGTVSHPDAVAAGLRAAGVRATVGVWAWDIEEGPFAAPADEVLDRVRAMLDANPPGGLVEGWVTLIGHSLASDQLLAGAADLARARGVGMTMHLSPTSSDPEVYLQRHGCRPVVHLDRLGVLGPHLLLGHGVWFDDDEVDAVLRTGTAVAYCPWAYLRLGQGVTSQGRHAEMATRHGRVALGCDSVTAGDTVDVLRTAALAAGLAKDQRIDPTWFGAHEALEMATIGGAEAIGMADRIGSLEADKRADLVVFETGHLHWAAPADPALALVWATDGRHVRHVVVDGQVAVDDGRCVTVDEAELRREAARASTALLDRAGLVPPVRWPVERG